MTYEEIDPSSWSYQNEGDFIEGILVNVEHDVGENKSNLYHIETPEGVRSVWGSAVLDQRMPFVKVGEKVKITFKGLGEKKSGKNAPKIFKVEVNRE